MNAVKATAHRAGALYFVFMILGITRAFFSPTFMVSGDAAATARNIMGAEPAYRAGLLTDFVSQVMFIYLVAVLYKLLRHGNKNQAVLMVLLVLAGVAIAVANLIFQFVPLALLSGAGYLSSFSKPQLEALSLGFLTLHGTGVSLATAFWGLWLFPFGYLVIKSGYFPRILGVFLMIAGVGYVVLSATSIAMPEARQALFRYLMPLFFGEVPIILWLLIKGAKVPAQATALSGAP